MANCALHVLCIFLAVGHLSAGKLILNVKPDTLFEYTAGSLFDFTKIIKTYRDDLESMKQKLDIQVKSVAVLKTSVSAQNSLMAALNSTVTSQNAIIESLNSTIYSQNATIESLNATISSHQQDAKDEFEDKTNLLTQLDTLNSSIASQNATIESLISSITSQNAITESLNSTITSQNATIESLNSTISSHQQEAKDEFEDKTNLIIQLKTRLDQQKKQASVLNSTIDALKATIAIQGLRIVLHQQDAKDQFKDKTNFMTQLQTRLVQQEKQDSDLQEAMFLKSETYKGHHYLLSGLSVERIELAEYFCNMSKGYLVEIDDEAEYQFIVDFLDFKGNHPNVFLGATKDDSGQWMFRHSGNPVSFFKWANREPNEDRKCMLLYYIAREMYEISCILTSPYSFLCEVQDI